jgi:hypothetical protein
MIDTRNKGGKITSVEVPGFDITRATFVNITVIDPKDAGFVTVWPCASPKPDSSNLNFQSGVFAQDRLRSFARLSPMAERPLRR